MALRGHRFLGRRKVQTKPRSQAAKDEKARYERCRRRRIGLIKKLDEFHTLFNAEVYFLVKSKEDHQQVHWYSSEDHWAESPDTMAGAIRMAAREKSRPEKGEREHTGANSDSASESADLDTDRLLEESADLHSEFESAEDVQNIQDASAGFSASLSELLISSKTVRYRLEEYYSRLEE